MFSFFSLPQILASAHFFRSVSLFFTSGWPGSISNGAVSDLEGPNSARIWAKLDPNLGKVCAKFEPNLVLTGSNWGQILGQFWDKTGSEFGPKLGNSWPNMAKNENKCIFWPGRMFSSIKTTFWPIYESLKALFVKSMKIAENLEF